MCSSPFFLLLLIFGMYNIRCAEERAHLAAKLVAKSDDVRRANASDNWFRSQVRDRGGGGGEIRGWVVGKNMKGRRCVCTYVCVHVYTFPGSSLCTYMHPILNDSTPNTLAFLEIVVNDTQIACNNDAFQAAAMELEVDDLVEQNEMSSGAGTQLQRRAGNPKKGHGDGEGGNSISRELAKLRSDLQVRSFLLSSNSFSF